MAKARNEALGLARAAGLPFDYLLLSDADMELIVEDPGLRHRLAAPAYSLRQRNGLAYDNIRLLHREAAARYVGVTHEYLAVEGRVERLEGAWFRDHACGSNRQGKLERDRRLLEADLAEHPDAPRPTFYLAQTLRDLGEYARARELYQLRADLAGFEEEAWYSVYQAGLCCLAEGEDTIQTQNWIATLGADGRLTEARKVEDRTGGERFPFQVRGLEDGRLISWRDRLWMSATVRDRSPSGRCEMTLVELDESGAAIAATIDRDIEPELHQKNWMPFVEGGVLRFVYGLDPLRIVGFEPGESRFRELTRRVPQGHSDPPPQEPGWALDHLRGGSQGVPLPDGWLFLTHEAVEQEGWRCYLHRFVRLDRGLRVTAVGEPFFFEQRGIEFAAGLLHDPASGRLLLTYGVEDRRAMLASLPLGDVLRELSGAATDVSDEAPSPSLPRAPAARASDPTFVSMFFDLQSAEGRQRRGAEFYLSNSHFLLSRDINLIIYTEERYRDFFLQARADKRLLSKTSVVTRRLTELPYYHRLGEVQRNRELHPLLNGNPDKDTPLYTVLGWSKVGFVIEAIGADPFSSRHFGWVDLAISHVASQDAGDESFRNLHDQMSLLVLREPQPADGLEDGMSFYDYERRLIAAEYFTGERARWLEFAAEVERERSRAASRGYSPSEQQIFARIIFRNRKSYRLYQGNYAAILSRYHAAEAS